MPSYSQLEKEQLWEKWIQKPIFLDNGVHNIQPRHIGVYLFVKNGVEPLLRSKGYCLNGKLKDVSNSLLRYMFALYLGEKVIFQNPYPDILEDHIDEYEHRMDTMELESFWERWGSLEDFSEDRYAYPLQYTLPTFLWAHIDLENSDATIKLENQLEEMREVEEYENAKKGLREDPYLHETSRINYEDRHWH